MAAAGVRGRVGLTVGALLVAGLVPAGTAAAAPVSISDVLSDLVVQGEVTTPAYDRDLFEHWSDVDGDGCNTRAELLIAASMVPVGYSSGCTVASGEWTSVYDGQAWTNASDVDIDHLVPLEETWASGASHWTSDQREAYANDLDFPGALIVMTDNLNQSKGSSDPAQWLPPARVCEYLTAWVLVKWRWSLAVDASELATLQSELVTGCADPSVETPARMGVPAPVPPTQPFPDVAASHPFAGEITWLAGTGITTGYADGTFRPGALISRDAFAAFLYRYTHEGADAPACTRQWFTDVPVTHPFCGEITWLAGTGIATGYADGTFHPSSPIARDAVAAMLHRYRDASGDVSTTCEPGLFTDITGNPFCGAITWLAGSGITTGHPDGTFRPGAGVTREAFAAFLYRYDHMFGPSDPPIVVTPPEPPTPPQPPNPPPPPNPPANPGNTRNCSDFATWAAAQAWFNTYYPYYGDVAQLDSDNDLIACESLPGAP